MTVAVAIITGGDRPEELGRLLASLVDMDGADDQFEVVVVLVENGPAPTFEVPEAISGRLRILKSHEARRGIPFARNRSVELSLESGADYIAFVDDDERVSRRWLVEGLTAIRDFGAQGVAGRVDYEFETPPPAWLRQGGFYDSPTIGHGSQMSFARTTNLLLDAGKVRALGGKPFDETLRFTGGSDIRFTERIVGAGARIVWSQNASTIEFVPEVRCRPDWALRRAYRVGNNIGRRKIASGGGRGVLTALIGGLGRLPYASGLICIGALMRNPSKLGKGIRIAARGTGMLFAPLHQYEEYKDDAS